MESGQGQTIGHFGLFLQASVTTCRTLDWSVTPPDWFCKDPAGSIVEIRPKGGKGGRIENMRQA